MAEPFIAQIMIFAGNFPPRGWAFCDGQLMPISQNTALFSLIGTTFGGDGRTTFALPDLRGRVPVHPGHGPGLSPVTWGESGGTENVTLTINEIPSHTHAATARCFDNLGDGPSPINHSWAGDAGGQSLTYSSQAPNASMHADSVLIGSAGGSQPHTNMQPYLGIYFCIALAGIFPSRS